MESIIVFSILVSIILTILIIIFSLTVLPIIIYKKRNSNFKKIADEYDLQCDMPTYHPFEYTHLKNVLIRRIYGKIKIHSVEVLDEIKFINPFNFFLSWRTAYSIYPLSFTRLRITKIIIDGDEKTITTLLFAPISEIKKYLRQIN